MFLSRFHSFDDLSEPQWFGLLSESEGDEEKTYVYKLKASSHFELNGEDNPDGTYIFRASPSTISQFKAGCSVTKLPFSEIVYLSDLFTRELSSYLPSDDEMEGIAKSGEASKYFDVEIASTAGLSALRTKIRDRFFGSNLKGIIRRCLSAVYNFFRKYNLYFDTGIYWPGDSSAYADKVLDRIERVKRLYLESALDASKDILSERLGMSLEDFEERTPAELKRAYHAKVLVQHPDKTPDKTQLRKATDQFSSLNKIWKDYQDLLRMMCDLEKDERGIRTPKKRYSELLLDEVAPCSAKKRKRFPALED